MQLERDGTLATLSRNLSGIVVFNIVVSCIQKVAKQQTSRTTTIGSRIKLVALIFKLVARQT